MRILLTTTSFQDTPGPHHAELERAGFEIVRARGPIKEAELLRLIKEHGGFDGLLNGDDDVTAAVIDAALAAPAKLRVIAKYGIGLDSIDVEHATAKKVPVLFTPGVNHTTVAEHTIGLMIALSKHFWPHLRSVKSGGWKRITGTELHGKTLGLLGLGRIGQEVIRRADAFGMNCVAFDRSFDTKHDFTSEYGVQKAETIEDVLTRSDVVSLHMYFSEASRHLINRERIAKMKDGALLINTARGGFVDDAAVVDACKSGKLGGYAADVMEEEPPKPGHPFNDVDNIIVTPHVGSRTLESVARQATRAVRNLVNFLHGREDFIQANEF